MRQMKKEDVKDMYLELILDKIEVYFDQKQSIWYFTDKFTDKPSQLSINYFGFDLIQDCAVRLKK